MSLAAAYRFGSSCCCQLWLFRSCAWRRVTVVCCRGCADADPEMHRWRHLDNPNVDVHVSLGMTPAGEGFLVLNGTVHYIRWTCTFFWRGSRHRVPRSMAFIVLMWNVLPLAERHIRMPSYAFHWCWDSGSANRAVAVCDPATTAGMIHACCEEARNFSQYRPAWRVRSDTLLPAA